MRKIYIRFKDINKFSYKLLVQRGLVNFVISAENTHHQVVLLNPELKRSLLGGVHILDHRGRHDKWFSDTNSSSTPLWKVG